MISKKKEFDSHFLFDQKKCKNNVKFACIWALVGYILQLLGQSANGHLGEDGKITGINTYT